MPKKPAGKLKAILAVDTGGTFTDFYLSTAQGARIHKVLSTPKDPGRAILQGIRDLGVWGTALVHGSTVATNAFLERKGAKVALIWAETRKAGALARAAAPEPPWRSRKGWHQTLPSTVDRSAKQID